MKIICRIAGKDGSAGSAMKNSISGENSYN